MDKGIELIKKWEGLRLNAYLCPAKVWTIGYGSTRINGRPVKKGDKLANEKEADNLLRQSIKVEFLPALEKIPVWRKLNRNQQGALLSFAYNLGANFYGSNGFETITKALNNDLNAVPEAMMLYVMGGGKRLDGLVNRRKEEGLLWMEPVQAITPTEPNPIDLIKYPATVLIGEKFDIIGKFYGEPDVKIMVLADGKFPLPECQVKDGVIDYECVLNTDGDRRITFNYQNHSQSIDIKVTSIDKTQTVKSDLILMGSVGNGGKNNPEDVKKAQFVLKELGYSVGEVDGKVGAKTIQAIKLFQSIINGQSTVSSDGRIDANGKTHKWLNAKNAPRWQIMPNTNKAIGFRNRELEETQDHHDYGTDWMAGMLLWIAKKYQADYLSKNPKASLFTINDVSLPTGGNTPDHSGHETGLACDIYLPRTDGNSGGIDYLSASYDRNASRAMLKAINSCPTINKSRIFFNDPILVSEGLCRSVRGHHHHFHIEVKVPPIQY
jgi:GH24 family phage-related lysozyme (muramidase)/peptidoglycan hydrolase-like protein with peptidoglycan-binding domain